MDIARFWIENRVITFTLTFVILGGGLASFTGMSRLEDPEFTIKDALVITPYQGASAAEVEEEVTDRIEEAAQQLGQLDELESKSDRGLSTVTVSIKKKYDKDSLPQVWDELRRKVGDVQRDLPPGAGPSLVVDDYGDVYGVFVALYGPEYSYAELKNTADFLRKELLLVQDVAKIETFGERVEAIYVEPQRELMAQLGIDPDTIADELRRKNVVSDAGRVQVGPNFISIVPTGLVESVEEFGDILISRGTTQQIFLRDIATIRRGYVDPPPELLRYDGTSAIGLGISTASGGNVVEMGNALRERIQELLPQLPLGMEFGLVSLQSQAVEQAIAGFTNSLIQAVAIVVVVLLFFMGLRSGLLIGAVLVVTIVGSFMFLEPWGVALERISLGALIIALGMLVDNAIVVVDGVLVRQQRGMAAKDAAIEVVGQSAIPLAGATVVAILAFAAIGTSDDSTGEFCRSLFQVVLVSLSFSWVTAVTLTPLLCVLFLPSPTPAAGATGSQDAEAPGRGDGAGGADGDPFDTGFYRAFGSFLHACIRLRWATMGLVVGLFALSVYGFRYVDQSFFPPSTRPQFMVDLWFPQGQHIDVTAEKVARAEAYLEELEDVTHLSSMIGKGGLRFLLTYTPEKLNSAYAQILVDVDDPTQIDALIPRIESELGATFPDATVMAFKFELGPGANGKVRPRFSGPDPDVLRDLADQTVAIFEADGNAKGIRTDWRQRVMTLRPVLAEQQASLNGITRPDVATTIARAFQGSTVGLYREGDLLLPIVVRAPAAERLDVSSLRSVQIWSPAAQSMIPILQVVSGFETVFEDEIIWRKDRKRTINIFADPKTGPASSLLERVRPKVEAIPLPTGYALVWGGEYEDSANAQGPLFAALPAFVMAMIVITIALFNSLRQPLVIWLNVPLALIGVTGGLLAASQPFGFMALLGFLSLMGMLIKNAVVLIDEINLQQSEGRAPLDAVVGSAISRLRPVAMAASTTALGMIPLLFDAFFISMAVTIIAGLIVGTVLTMIVLPVSYSIFFRIPSRSSS